MSECRSATRLTLPLTRMYKHFGALFCLAPLLGACGHMDANVNRENFSHAGQNGTQLGSFQFSFDDGETQHPYIIPVRRVAQGYALQAPLYSDDDSGVKANFEVSKTQDFHWFVGPKLSWNF